MMNQYTVLGTLVDRAVSMPYAKPQQIEGGRRSGKEPATISEDVKDAAELLVKVLGDPRSADEQSQARLVVDAGGLWWSDVVNKFNGLGHNDDDGREWILKRLVPTAMTTATALEKEARAREWTWLWSQPSLVRADDDYPKATRPDLVGGAHKQCAIIDIKTTKGSLDKVKRSEVRFLKWRDDLRAMDFEVNHCLILAVSSVKDESCWHEVDLQDPPSTPGR